MKTGAYVASQNGPGTFFDRPFTTLNSGNAAIRGCVSSPLTRSHGRCILVQPFGVTQKDLLVPTYYLLRNGFEVVRFDPTNHVGVSDGSVSDFTISRLCEDIRHVLESFKASSSSVISFSLSMRPTLRAMRNLEFASLWGILPVFNMRSTLKAVCGDDLIGMYLDGVAPDSYTILNFDVKRAFCADCVAAGFDGLEGSIRDAAQIETPTRLVLGDKDPWIAQEDVNCVGDAFPNCSFYGVSGGSHQIFRSPVLFDAYMALIIKGLFRDYGIDAPVVLPPFREVIAFANQSKRQEETAMADEGVCR
jgi:Acyl transferase